MALRRLFLQNIRGRDNRDRMKGIWFPRGYLLSYYKRHLTARAQTILLLCGRQFLGTFTVLVDGLTLTTTVTGSQVSSISGATLRMASLAMVNTTASKSLSLGTKQF